MKISGIVYDSIVDGEGIRNTIFISGCSHKCKNCHNPKTWDFNYGEEFNYDKQIEFIIKCKQNVLLDGITISGGDPMHSAKELLEFIELYKKHNPTHTIWIYSGFTYDELVKNKYQNDVLKLCDVLVDGKYIDELRDITLNFRGSSNQRILKLH